MSDFRDDLDRIKFKYENDHIALRKLKEELPKVAYPERDSLLFYILNRLGWKEEHSIEASVPDGPYVQFVKMINPDK